MDKITFTALFTTSTEVPYVMNPVPPLGGVKRRRWNGLTAQRKRTAESRHTGLNSRQSSSLSKKLFKWFEIRSKAVKCQTLGKI